MAKNALTQFYFSSFKYSQSFSERNHISTQVDNLTFSSKKSR